MPTESYGNFGLDAWRAALELGLKVQINTTVTGHNLTDLADIAALVNRLGAVSWSAFLLVPTGRGALLPALTAQQAEDVLFISDKGPIINTLWCCLMLKSDAECGSVRSSDVCVAFPYRQEFAGNL